MLPVWQRSVPVLLVAASVLLLARMIMLRSFARELLRILLPMILFYLLHVVGLAYSTNLDFGLFDLEIKLSFLLLPFVVGGSALEKTDIKKILIAFVVGCVGAVCYDFAQATYHYFETYRHPNQFTSSWFSALMHLGYFAMYLDFAVAICIYLLQESIEQRALKKSILLIVTISLMAFAVILTTSKMGIIVLLVVFMLGGVYLARKSAFKKTIYIAVALAIVGSALLVTQKPEIKKRFVRAYNGLVEDRDSRNLTGSTNSRLAAWSSAAEIIKDNFFFGVGTGDVKEELKKQYVLRNFETEKLHLNAHSQYVQTFVALGVFGALSLIWIFVSGFIQAFKRRNFMLLALMVIAVMNAITESIFEVQAGVVFLALMISLLVSSDKRSRHEARGLES